MLPVPLAHPERAAAASIRGYLFQIVGIAYRWLFLAEGELLLCEGDEDADHYLLDEHGTVRDVTQVQFKDVAGRLSVRDERVQESIFNFLRAYHFHSERQRTVHFIFTTSAIRARQQKTKRDGQSRRSPALAIDVLETWTALRVTADRAIDQGALIEELRALVSAARPASQVTGSKAHRDYDELMAAVAYLDANPGRWKTFLDVVEWQFKQPAAADQIARLEEALANDPRTRGLPPPDMARRLIVKVLETSSEGNADLRILDSATLTQFASISRQELELWAAKAHPERLGPWMTDIVKRLDQLDAKTAQHEERFENHEARIRKDEGAPLDALLRLSERNLAYLSDSECLRLGDRQVRIRRAAIDAIADAAVIRSLVVVGDPGVGKTGVLATVAAELRQRGIDVVALTADVAHGLGDALIDTLESWPGEQAGVVLIDALDSVRDESKATSLRKLIGDLTRSAMRWRVIASIRTFDLYQGAAIARVFEGAPPTGFSDSRFPRVRHVSIRALTDDELKQIEIPAPNLYAMASGAPAEFQALLRNPFHLSLAATLLEGGVTSTTLSLVRSRLELLDLYWRHRVASHAPAKDGRESLLRQICECMIEQQSLQVPKAGLNVSHLYDLLTANVLREPPSETDAHDDAYVAFGHHVLFDYAVARLWVPREAVKLTHLLTARPLILLFTRPSLEMALQMLWVRDSTRRTFWDVVLQICRHSAIREVGKIMGPSVAAQEALVWADLQPLVDALTRSDDGASGADIALSYLVGALVPVPRGGRQLVGPDAGPWAQLAECITLLDRGSVRVSSARLLTALTEKPGALTATQLAYSGRAARMMFSPAMRGDVSARLLVSTVRFVCRTFDSDPDAAAKCIRSLLHPDILKSILPTLARETPRLFSDPILVRNIYATAFAITEDSTEVTTFGGAVFSMASNRRQDYEGGLYSLRTVYDRFLRSAPQEATRALIQVLRAYVERERSSTAGGAIEGTFLVNGQEARIVTDYSEIWASREHQNELAMLETWQKYVAELAQNLANEPLVRALFQYCVEDNRLALIWRTWLKLGANPSAVKVTGPIVLPLLQSAHVLCATDTAYLAGEAIRTVFVSLASRQRAGIEDAILATRSLEKTAERADKTCSRLLGCIDPNLLVTPEALSTRQGLIERGVAAPNEPIFSRLRMDARPVASGADTWLREEGARIDEEPHKTVHEASRALTDSKKALSLESPVSACDAFLDEAIDLARLLVTTGGVHPAVLDDGWGAVAQALHAIIPLPSFMDPLQRSMIIDLAKEVTNCPCPRLGEDSTFHEYVSWGNPHARGDVAEVLTALALVDGNESVLSLLEQLAEDHVASVRARALSELGELAHLAPSAVWRIAARITAEERVRGVLAAFIAGTLNPLTTLDPNRVARWIGCLLSRVVAGPGAPEVRRLCYELLARLHIRGNEPRASALVRECTLRADSADIAIIAQHVRIELSAGPVDPPDKEADARRRRAQALLSQVVTECVRALSDFPNVVSARIPDAALPRVRQIVENLQICAREICFASGAHGTETLEAVEVRDPQVEARFLDELAEVLELLSQTGIPTIVHSVVETLEYLLPHNPTRAFHLVARAVAAGKLGSYQYDSMAVDLIIKIVTTFLADYRDRLQEDVALRDALLDVLDVFVEAGWPEAQALTYGLQDIFR